MVDVLYSAPVMTAPTSNVIQRGGLRGLLDFLHEQRARGLSLAMATVVETCGATYRKAGAAMLIAADGRWRGLLSGGCLEGDLAHHAGDVIRGAGARVVEYDLEAMTDAVFGFGLGCEGSVRVLLEGIGPENDWEPLASLGRLAMQGVRGCHLRVVDSTVAEWPVGTWCTTDETGSILGTAGLTELAGPAPLTGVGEYRVKEGRLRLLATAIPRVPRLVVLGAAPDAKPVVHLAAALGWRITVVDHRPAFADSGALPGADQVLLTAGDDLPFATRLDAADAVIIMSHNLEADARYLRAALAAPVGYIGLLGPVARRNRLLEMAGAAPTDRGRVYGPVGLDLGGEGPEAVALAIIAEIQMVLAQRTGAHRDPR